MIEWCQSLLLRRNFSVSDSELGSWSYFLLKLHNLPYTSSCIIEELSSREAPGHAECGQPYVVASSHSSFLHHPVHALWCMLGRQVILPPFCVSCLAPEDTGPRLELWEP